MKEAPDQKRASPWKKAFLIAGISAAWLLALLAAFSYFRIQPERQYANWLAAQRSLGTPTKFDRIAARFGVHIFYRQRARNHHLTGEALLENPDYALAVASWSRFQPQALSSWPKVKKALQELKDDKDPQRLVAAFQRCDADGPLQWELTLLRNAELAGALDQIESVENLLREYDENRGSDPSLSNRFTALAGIYLLPAAELITRRLEATSGSVIDVDIGRILSVRGVSLGRVFHEWLRSITSGLAQIPSEAEIVRVFQIPDAAGIRSELLTWILTSKDAETWRASPDRDLPDLLAQCMTADHAGTWNAISSAIRTLGGDSEGRADDWATVARRLLDLAAQEKNLMSVINADAGGDFTWVCHLLNDEALLVKSIRCWGSSFPAPWTWIGHFVDASQFAAIAALTEVKPWFIHQIQSETSPPTSQNPPPLAYFKDLNENIAPHCISPSHRAFVELVISAQAENVIMKKPEGEAAKNWVLESIDRFNGIKDREAEFLQPTLDIFESFFPERLSLIPEPFLQWAGHPNIDDAVHAILDGSTTPDNTASRIWSKYLQHVILPSKTPSLLESAQNLTREGPGSGQTRELLDRFDAGLGFLGSSNSFESNITSVLTLIVSRWIAEGDPAVPLPWMFARIKELERHDPKVAEEVLNECFKASVQALSERPRGESWNWYLAILNPSISGEFDWPERPPYFLRDRFPPLDPRIAVQILEKELDGHPLGPWLARVLLESEYQGDKREIRERNYEQLKAASPSGWLAEIVDDIRFSRPVDPIALESALKTAPANARCFFLKKVVNFGPDLSKTRDPWVTALPPEQRTRLFLWEGGEILSRFETAGEFDDAHFEHLFRNLLAFVEVDPGNEGIVALARRLQECSFTRETTGYEDGHIKRMLEWRQRTAWIADARGSLLDSLTTNDALPITERVWKLAINNRIEDAARLMIGHEDQLDFRRPEGTQTTSFRPGEIDRFPAILPEKSEHRMYAETYLAYMRAQMQMVYSPFPPQQRWPRILSEFQFRDTSADRLSSLFSETQFKSSALEKQVALHLSAIQAVRPKMLGHLIALRDRPYGGDRDFQLALARSEFDQRLARGDFENIPERLDEIYLILKDGNIVVEACEYLPYHLWRRALINETFTDAHRTWLESIAFDEQFPTNLTRKFNSTYPALGNDLRQLRLQSIHFALAMIEKGPDEGMTTDWRRYAALDLARYDSLGKNPTGFLWETSLILASRCQDWSEQARWNLIALMQTPPAGVAITKPLTTFSAFMITDFMKEDEVKRRLRDFTLRFPQNGYTALDVVQIGRRFKDADLESFGRNEASRYRETNPAVERRLSEPPPRTP